jgi:ACR3 family arsenite efflux pump ArsB
VLSLCCVCYLGESSQGSHVGTKFFVFIPISLILHFLTRSWSQKRTKKINYMREFCWFSSSLLIISVVPHLKKNSKMYHYAPTTGQKAYL